MTGRRGPIVAIDGPAGSGKSTVAKLVAERAGMQFISSGAMYRAVAVRAMREGVSAADRARLIQLADETEMTFRTEADGAVRTFMDGEDVTAAIRERAVDQVASVIATIAEVRERLVARQQALGKDGDIVMEGRDIQTVVFPEAEIKIFLLASAEERARRRWKEMTARGERVDFPAVLAEVRARDARDTERVASPLRVADDAIRVETDGHSVEEVVQCLLRIIDAWRRDPRLAGWALAQAAGCDLARRNGGTA